MTLALSQIALSNPDVAAELKQLESWASDFNRLLDRLAPRFKRTELRAGVQEYL